MACCRHCEGVETEFGERTARRELKRYRRRGPPRSTRLLLAALRREGTAGATLLDVGGGIGAIHHELLDDGARGAVHVDASSAYLAAARSEAAMRGHEARLDLRHGDFVELAPQLTSADIVTLDRVVCCYPDMPALVEASASKARRLCGLVYPRRTWWLSLVFPLLPNLYFRLRRSAFRVFLHDPAAIEATVRRCGLTPVSRAVTLLWEVTVFRREGGGARRPPSPDHAELSGQPPAPYPRPS